MGTMMLLATSIESKAADLFGKSENLSANKGKETEQDAGLLPNKEKKHPANNPKSVIRDFFRAKSQIIVDGTIVIASVC